MPVVTAASTVITAIRIRTATSTADIESAATESTAMGRTAIDTVNSGILIAAIAAMVFGILIIVDTAAKAIEVTGVTGIATVAMVTIAVTATRVVATVTEDAAIMATAAATIAAGVTTRRLWPGLRCTPHYDIDLSRCAHYFLFTGAQGQRPRFRGLNLVDIDVADICGASSCDASGSVVMHQAFPAPILS